MWIARAVRPASRLPSWRLCRRYGYVHVPKKTTPHILGHGSVWRSCYKVHPSSQVVDPFTKYQWLTKTAVINGLPERVKNVIVPNADELVADLKERVTETLAYQTREKPEKLHRTDMAAGLLQAAFASIWLRSAKFNHLSHSNLTCNPITECYWRRNGENYLCQTQPMYMLHTANPLELFCDPETAPERSEPLLARYQPSFLGLFKHSFDQIVPFGGCKRQAPYSFAHTLFVEDKKCRTTEQTLANGLLQLFSQAAGETVQNGYKLDSDLHFPLASQAVLTNGRSLTFLCYQLNTLDLGEPEGRRTNFLWVGPTLDLFDRIKKGEGLANFSSECGHLLAQFLFHRPLRAKPSLSGFVLALQEEKAKVEKRLAIKQYLRGLKEQKALKRAHKEGRKEGRSRMEKGEKEGATDGQVATGGAKSS